MEPIERGTRITVTDAFGEDRVKRVLDLALGGRYEAVWACSEEEWSAAELEGREPEAEPFPWPMRSVRVAELA